MSSLQTCFCLCDTEYAECSCPNFDSCSKCQCECLPKPAAKKKRSDLPVKDPDRFKFLSSEDSAKLQKSFVPSNTQRSTNWSLKVFSEWKKAREDANLELCPDDLLECAVPENLSKWLPLFAAESRNGKGRHYTPATISQLLSGILRHMREINPACPNFLDKKDHRFKLLHNGLDNYYHQLRTMNIGTDIKHAEIFSKSEESMLWESGTMGIHSPQALFNAVFFLNGKNFCLRGGEEHRSLKLSQFKKCQYPLSYTYVENGSKNRNGTFSQRNLPNKTVPIYSNPDLKERCHVYILDLYISKLPPLAFENDVFYVRPLTKIPIDKNIPWFTSVPIGKNELAKSVQKMCQLAGIPGHKTNHSLRATGASQLFQASVPEKIIQERTGHRSLEALRQYERTTTEQHEAVSEVLSSEKPVTFQSVIQKQEKQQTVTRSALSPLTNISPVLNISGCTVNIQFNHPPPSPPLPPLPEIGQQELDELFLDF